MRQHALTRNNDCPRQVIGAPPGHRTVDAKLVYSSVPGRLHDRYFERDRLPGLDRLQPGTRIGYNGPQPDCVDICRLTVDCCRSGTCKIAGGPTGQRPRRVVHSRRLVVGLRHQITSKVVNRSLRQPTALHGYDGRRGGIVEHDIRCAVRANRSRHPAHAVVDIVRWRLDTHLFRDQSTRLIVSVRVLGIALSTRCHACIGRYAIVGDRGNFTADIVSVLCDLSPRQIAGDTIGLLDRRDPGDDIGLAWLDRIPTAIERQREALLGITDHRRQRANRAIPVLANIPQSADLKAQVAKRIIDIASGMRCRDTKKCRVVRCSRCLAQQLVFAAVGPRRDIAEFVGDRLRLTIGGVVVESQHLVQGIDDFPQSAVSIVDKADGLGCISCRCRWHRHPGETLVGIVRKGRDLARAVGHSGRTRVIGKARRARIARANKLDERIYPRSCLRRLVVDSDQRTIALAYRLDPARAVVRVGDDILDVVSDTLIARRQVGGDSAQPI